MIAAATEQGVLMAEPAASHVLDSVPEALRDDIEDVLIDEARIQARLDELAAEIDRDYAGREVLLIGVLKGAILLMADLTRRLTISSSIDFMAVSSYGSATSSSGTVRILKDLDAAIEGLDVLIVEDIVDSGLTLDYLMKNLRSRKPASLEVVALLTKPTRREVDIPVRYVGFEVPDVFVVGYGLDYAEQYRGVRSIVTLKPEVYGG